MRGRRKEEGEGGRRERGVQWKQRGKKEERGDLYLYKTGSSGLGVADSSLTVVAQTLQSTYTTQQRQFIRNSPLTTIRTDAQII